MKTLVPLVVYALLSGLIGVLACTFLAWRGKPKRTTAWVAAVFFGGPLFCFVYLEVKEKLEQRQFEDDVAYVKELCTKFGGDKVYRSVDNVQGVFQIRARPPNTDRQWADQFGSPEPWAIAFGDSDASAVGIAVDGSGYWFIEQQPGYGKPDGPPYRRKFVQRSSVAPTESRKPVFKDITIEVPTLMSRYGYVTEDLSTPELRKRWIGGGRLKIIDLQTREVLAERTDYYRASGPNYKMAWAAGISCRQDKLTGLSGFIRSVLHPPHTQPTDSQLSSLNRE